ncbi:jacalin-related lectin 24-like [Beta vulgaris subsp. vulgaris]|uniref:jacalin-related lectin 24-like n=1 Tax=Beta vulgaris subsp. vulgaris TaxID=3555 RepID=UPI00254909F8|nr:jacalin-related lectin 24-like [Beta vulgaris subsp. vulgaris]
MYVVATNLLKVGPLLKGDSLTEPWDDKGRSMISKIIITYEKNDITSLQFEYVEDGKSVLSDLYGERTGSNFKMMTLGLGEYITCLSGTYESGAGHGIHNQVISITIHTSNKKYGRFGGGYSVKVPTHEFSYQFGPKDQFGGFHGSFRDGKLESIGVYVKFD